MNTPIPAAVDWDDCGNYNCRQLHNMLDQILIMLCHGFDKSLESFGKRKMIYDAIVARDHRLNCAETGNRDLKRNAAEAENQIVELRADLASERYNIEAMGSQIEEIRAELGRVVRREQDNLEAADIIKAELRAELGKVTKRSHDRTNERDDLQIQQNGLFEEIAALKDALKNALAGPNRPIIELRDELSAALSRESGLRGQVENLGKEVCRLNNEHCVELNELNNQIIGLRDELLTAIRRSDAHSNARNEMLGSRAELMGQAERLSTELIKTECQLSDAHHDISDLKEALEKAKAENLFARDQAYETECAHDAEIKVLQREMDALEGRLWLQNAPKPRSTRGWPFGPNVPIAELEETALRRFIHEDIVKTVREVLDMERYSENLKKRDPRPMNSERGSPHWPEETDAEGPDGRVNAPRD